jgi:hypothetical protein
MIRTILIHLGLGRHDGPSLGCLSNAEIEALDS